MKKYILLLALLLSSTTFAVEPKFNDNFKQTKNEIETSDLLVAFINHEEISE